MESLAEYHLTEEEISVKEVAYEISCLAPDIIVEAFNNEGGSLSNTLLKRRNALPLLPIIPSIALFQYPAV